MKTITGELTAYVSQYSGLQPQDFKAPTDAMVGQLYYARLANDPEGWTKVGKATVTVEFAHQDVVISNKVKALRAQLQTHRAESNAVAKRLENQISNLLAISYDEVKV